MIFLWQRYNLPGRWSEIYPYRWNFASLHFTATNCVRFQRAYEKFLCFSSLFPSFFLKYVYRWQDVNFYAILTRIKSDIFIDNEWLMAVFMCYELASNNWKGAFRMFFSPPTFHDRGEEDEAFYIRDLFCVRSYDLGMTNRHLCALFVIDLLYIEHFFNLH